MISFEWQALKCEISTIKWFQKSLLAQMVLSGSMWNTMPNLDPLIQSLLFSVILWNWGLLYFIINRILKLRVEGAQIHFKAGTMAITWKIQVRACCSWCQAQWRPTYRPLPGDLKLWWHQVMLRLFGGLCFGLFSPLSARSQMSSMPTNTFL